MDIQLSFTHALWWKVLYHLSGTFYRSEIQVQENLNVATVSIQFYDVNFGVLYIELHLSCHDRLIDDKPLASRALSGISPRARETHDEVLPMMLLLVFE